MRQEPERPQRDQREEIEEAEDQEEEKFLYPDPKDPDWKPPLPEGS